MPVGSGLRLTPRQLFEASRLADRLGPTYAEELDGGRVLLLLATRLDGTGAATPDLAVELDADGRIVGSQYLELRHRDNDEFSDLGDEQPLPPPEDVRDARPAKLCECPAPFGHDGHCVRCGRTLDLAVGLGAEH